MLLTITYNIAINMGDNLLICFKFELHVLHENNRFYDLTYRKCNYRDEIVYMFYIVGV